MCRSTGPMTDPGSPVPLDPSAFYDSLAPDYDSMTGFEMRFVREKPFFRLLVENRRIGTALDAGCGTGFHSLLLAGLGARVTAVDVSAEMLDRLRLHAGKMNLDIRSVRSDFGRLRDVVSGPFDAVFCMGNTLPHLPGEKEIRAALETFSALLRPGGMLFLQILNYDRILATRERIQGVRESNGMTFVRFYDFDEDGRRIRFNILRLEKKEGKVSHSLVTVPLIPLMARGTVDLIGKCGFREVSTFGSVAMEPFDESESRDLVILATTP